MKRFTLFLLMVAALMSGRASETWSQFLTMETDTAEYVTPKDTTVYFPPVDTTHYEPVDTGEVVRPDVPSKPVIYVPTIHEGDNVTEFPHNPAVDDMLSSEKPAKQEFTMTIEGDYLCIKGTLMARGYGKHYIHCQIIGDSVHLQRFDMDPESRDMILHNVDIRIPGFTEDYYKVTLAEQNDVPLYKQYMVMAKAVTRSATYKPTEFSVTGTKWYVNSHYSNSYRGTYRNTLVSYGLDGDTIIDGNIWKKLYKDTSLLGYLREADGKVWVYPENIGDLYPYKKGEPFILYDFTLQKGDTIYLNLRTIGITSTPNSDYDYWEYVVKEVRFEHGRKIIDFGYEQWIEGVGSNSSAFFDLWKFRPLDGSSSWEAVYQTVSNGKTFHFNGEVADPNAKSWLQEGMSWTQNWGYNETSNGRFQHFVLNEEIRPGTFVLGSTTSDSGNFFNHMQEFNGKVYVIDTFNHGIELCYDFTAQEGDKIPLLSYWYQDAFIPSAPIVKYDTCTVTKVDLVEINGTIRKRIFVKGEREDIWVEGIGSLTRVLPFDGFESASGQILSPSRITCLCKDEETLYLHPDFIDCTTSKANGIEYKDYTDEVCYIQFTASTLLCTAPNAVKLEVYTMDAIKVGEARFVDGKAAVKVGEAPAMYLYIVTYPDGRRESGKTVKN